MGNADIALRHLARRHPEALVQAMDIEGRVEIVGWLDTQVTALERRLDKALGLRVDSEPRALQIEFEYELVLKTMGPRIYAYQALFTIGRAREKPREPRLPIESLVVVLSGRTKAWPVDTEHRTGWPERRTKKRWSGVYYRIDAVYQRTVAELRARGSMLWWVFIPLARDATIEAVRCVARDLRASVTDREDLADLFAALLVMAEIDPWGYHRREEIAAMLQTEGRDLIDASKTLREAFDRGQQAGIEKGIEKGQRKAVEKMLRQLFVRRLGRVPTEQEQRSLVKRAKHPDEAQERALALEGDALVAWLLDPSVK